ncbi:MAG: hypothetical protein V1495_04700 [Pseudomonadota bacterium]
MKRTLIGMALLVPALCFAGNTVTAANPTHAKSHVVAKKVEASKKAETAMTKDINLTGGTEANRMEIEKIAKEAGATSASFDAKTGTLKVSAKSFDEAKFLGSVEKALPGVSLKK